MQIKNFYRVMPEDTMMIAPKPVWEYSDTELVSLNKKIFLAWETFQEDEENSDIYFGVFQDYNEFAESLCENLWNEYNSILLKPPTFFFVDYNGIQMKDHLYLPQKLILSFVHKINEVADLVYDVAIYDIGKTHTFRQS